MYVEGSHYECLAKAILMVINITYIYCKSKKTVFLDTQLFRAILYLFFGIFSLFCGISMVFCGISMVFCGISMTFCGID